MSGLFDDNKELLEEDDFVDSDDSIPAVHKDLHSSDARRRVEELMDRKQLEKELEDFADY